MTIHPATTPAESDGGPGPVGGGAELRELGDQAAAPSVPRDHEFDRLLRSAAGGAVDEPAVAAVIDSLHWLVAGCVAHASRVVDGRRADPILDAVRRRIDGEGGGDEAIAGGAPAARPDANPNSAPILEGDLCFARAERLAASVSGDVVRWEFQMVEAFCVAALRLERRTPREALRLIRVIVHPTGVALVRRIAGRG